MLSYCTVPCLLGQYFCVNREIFNTEIEIFYCYLDIKLLFDYNVKRVILSFCSLDDDWRKKMDISYNKLWKLMIDRNLNKSELRELTGIGTNTLAKLSKNQQVSMEVLLKICSRLDCDISDICEFVKED